MHIALVMNLPSSVHFSKFKFNYFNYISFFSFFIQNKFRKIESGVSALWEPIETKERLQC